METEDLNQTENFCDSFDDAQGDSSFTPPQLTLSQFKQLELIQHLTSYSELFISVIGDVGSGKTILASALAASREEPEHTIMMDADIMVGIPSILQRVAEFLNLASLSSDVSQAIQQITVALAELQAQGESLLVIIDEADQLDLETLQGLAQLADLEKQTLKFILFGSAELEANVLSIQASTPPVHIVHMALITEEETVQLIEEYFPEAKAWDLNLVKKIYQQSQGNPGHALLLADEIQNRNSGNKNSADYQGKFNFPMTHIVAISAVALVVIGAIFYQQHNTQDQELSSAPVAQDVTGEDQPVFKEPEKLMTPEEALAKAGLKDETVDYNFSEPTEVVAEPEVKSLSSAQQPQDNTIVEKVASIKSVEATIPPVAKPSQSSYQHDEMALLALDGDGYVVQLLGSYSKEGAVSFVRKNQPAMSATLYLYKTAHKGKDWYVVVAGNYLSRASAKQGVQKYPRALRSQQPWIRQTKSVQQAIR